MSVGQTVWIMCGCDWGQWGYVWVWLWVGGSCVWVLLLWVHVCVGVIHNISATATKHAVNAWSLKKRMACIGSDPPLVARRHTNQCRPLSSKELPIIHWGIPGGQIFGMWWHLAIFRENAWVKIEWDGSYCIHEIKCNSPLWDIAFRQCQWGITVNVITPPTEQRRQTHQSS